MAKFIQPQHGPATDDDEYEHASEYVELPSRARARYARKYGAGPTDGDESTTNGAGPTDGDESTTNGAGPTGGDEPTTNGAGPTDGDEPTTNGTANGTNANEPSPHDGHANESR